MTRDLEQLFAEWQSRELHTGKLFITDGPIDPRRWKNAEKRILFVAKEAYGEKDASGTWDLPTLVREEWGGPKYKFWWTCAYWALALRRTTIGQIADFPEYTEDYDPAREALMESAIMNIKKSAGLSSSDDDNLQQYGTLDGDLIARQVEILDPHVVLFCNTWHLVKHLFPRAREVSQFVFTSNDPPRVLINYWHPANQYPNSVMFYALSAVYQKSMKAGQQT